jgi:uncharacterized integral membrane protein (TIGR00697 family)
MNELLLLGQAAVSTLVVLVIWRYARERLFGIIALYLILITVSGGKIVEFFGHPTNAGNIFYASVYLATYFLIERMGRREGVKSIWLGVAGVLIFFMFTEMTLAFSSSLVASEFSDAFQAAHASFSRLTVASLIAYIVSQNLNVYLYTYLKRRLNGTYLWVRANVCNLIAQFLDSIIFFTVAFWGAVQPENIVDIMMTGFIIKVAFVAITTPLLLMNRVELEEGKDFSTISLR